MDEPRPLTMTTEDLDQLTFDPRVPVGYCGIHRGPIPRGMPRLNVDLTVDGETYPGVRMCRACLSEYVPDTLAEIERAHAEKNAEIDAQSTYRYVLTRDVAPITGEGTVTFVMLNPSTADETNDDPTVRRCIRFARDWGFARLKVVNLYAYRSTKPLGLWGVDDPVGPDNDHAISLAVGGSDLVVCAWGARAGPRLHRPREVLKLIAAPHCLALTASGLPRHPLYMPAAAKPVPFAHCPPEAAW